MVSLGALPRLPGKQRRAYRLVNSKFPPINVFDDVASAEEFQALYELQALTNPRLQNEAGRLDLIPPEAIPFGIPGCSYAVAPFTHVNPDGSHFSDGSFGVLYLGDTMDTALAEVQHHQEAYWRHVPDLSYERFVFRGLACDFDEAGMADGLTIHREHEIYSPDDYRASRQLGLALKEEGTPGLRYHSVRASGATCWALMTPRPVASMVQAAHFEMIWSGTIVAVNQVAAVAGSH
ncbi:RES family NAD+ phosphorylase [Halomonas campisalis]|uniref:RES family NAD+ phosphorylase n=1 Tax=Billgrantia campisalis TaxID=74661 RepID=A0ABS9P8A3_9GAMM|nr:RES family NAD+ phosphorylase [Halomonas campisalis]MCG6658007.1 RES family NAD+ phosphorylase [Halomonas campisalis]MDR5864841.1 RES family NAD+ phosphorylase [Halomonas campisalis]